MNNNIYKCKDFDFEDFKEEYCSKLDKMDLTFIATKINKELKKDNCFQNIELSCLYVDGEYILMIEIQSEKTLYKQPYVAYIKYSYAVNNVVNTFWASFHNKFDCPEIEDYYEYYHGEYPSFFVYFNDMMTKYVNICVEQRKIDADRRYKYYKENNI